MVCSLPSSLSETFSNPDVSKNLSELITVRMDFTNPDAEQNKQVAVQYKVVGLPCIMFLRPDGTEIPGSRISGFVPPEEFLGYLEKLR